MMILTLLMVLSVSMFSGCSIPFLNNDKPVEDDKEKDKDKNKDKEEENDKEEEDWIPNLDLTTQVPQSDTPIDENVNNPCTCTVLCSSNDINEACPYCTEDFHRCTGKQEEDPLDTIALPEGQTETVSIVAAGSNFYNTAIMNGTDKSRNYDYIYKNLKETLKNYDVKIITQETIFSNDPSKYSGAYPYKSPPSIATALVNAGFNVVSAATDHSFDGGRNGILDTLNTWKQYSGNTLVTGICASQESYDNLCMADINGIRIAFLSYTSSLNGATLTNDEKIYVKTLYNEDTVANEIKYASKVADFVIVMPHWGTETSVSKSINQEKWANIFIDNGADLILGTGPNVMQEVALYENKEGVIVPCYYSLGNLVSAKNNPSDVLSGLAEITISKTGKTTTIEKYDMIPTALHISKKGDYFQSYLLDEYPDETIKWHNLIMSKKKSLSLDGIRKQFEDTVEIVDIAGYHPGGEGSTMTIIQQQMPQNTSATVNTEEDNKGNPLVTDGNHGEAVTAVPSPSTIPTTMPDNLGNLQVIGN